MENSENNENSEPDLKVSEIIHEVVWKDNWRSKIDDPEITGIWLEESLEQGISKETFDMALSILKSIAERSLISVREADYCEKYTNAEDKHIRAKWNNDNSYDDWEDYDEKPDFCDCQYRPPQLSDFIREIKDLIPSQLRDRLRQSVSKLEAATEKAPDWHPGSNRQVLDLVHPSLYCYVKGVSQLENGKVESGLVPENTRYQWLPAEFRLQRNQQNITKVQIESYINNLSRYQYPDLYQEIEEIFAYYVPFFEQVLKKPLPERCQVIVKMANIILTPENPKYPGGAWHIEGMPYEQICATGIYYYQNEGIDGSYLQFRRALENLLHYPQNDYKYVEKHYGMHDEQQLNEYMGAIKTEEGKSLVFPNYLQHQVKPFELANPEKEGKRKILVFFLIDPEKRILSTADVPPQQRDAIQETLRSTLEGTMPRDILNLTAKYLPGFSLEDAKKYREKLMFQRKYFVNKLNNEVFEREFSLCEH